MKKVLGILAILFTMVSWLTFAADDIAIIPEWETSIAAEKVEKVSSGWKVWKMYRDVVENDNLSLWDQLASGIMSRDTILDYCAYLAKFIWEVALLVWAVAIIYFWYTKIVKNVKPEKSGPLWMIVIWLLVIIFAYAIVKLIRSAFIS